MCPLTLSALFGIATACSPAGPSNLLAPADPGVHRRWTPPPLPTTGLGRYAPVEATAQGWLGGDTSGKRPAAPIPPMPDMPGMSGHQP